jgi:hypothetical protein
MSTARVPFVMLVFKRHGSYPLVPRQPKWDYSRGGGLAERVRFQHSIVKLVNNSSTKLGCFPGFLGENQAEKQQKASNLGC